MTGIGNWCVIGASISGGFLAERELEAPSPIEPYVDQPYDRTIAAPAPPPQTTVEQTIETELDKSENQILRDWINYQLGSPGEIDPISGHINVPKPSGAPGDSGSGFAEELEGLGLEDVEFEVLSNPDFDPAYDEGAVVRVSPPPGTSVDPADKITVTVNRTGHRINNGECYRSTPLDPEAGPGDAFTLKDMFWGHDPDLGMSATEIPFRWGTLEWGYRHVKAAHGWDNDRDRTDTQAALADPAPEPDDPGSHRFYFFYLGPDRTPCTRRVVSRFTVPPGHFEEMGIITSFAHPGWFRKSDFPDSD